MFLLNHLVRHLLLLSITYAFTVFQRISLLSLSTLNPMSVNVTRCLQLRIRIEVFVEVDMLPFTCLNIMWLLFSKGFSSARRVQHPLPDRGTHHLW